MRLLSEMNRKFKTIAVPIAAEIINENHSEWRAAAMGGTSHSLGSNAPHESKDGEKEQQEDDKRKKQKRYPPISVGGVAGGTKFIAKGFLFKLAVDPKITIADNTYRYLYGGGELPDLDRAAKACAHELHGANEFYSFFLQHSINIQVPWQIIVDYRGFRIVVMPLLPLRNSQLIYGSCDGGKTIHNSDPGFFFDRAMQRAGAHLSLAGHNVHGTYLHSGGDVEGHMVEEEEEEEEEEEAELDDDKGREANVDNRANSHHHRSSKRHRYYLLDLARWAPPEHPFATTHLPSTPSSIFYRMLRPEYLRNVVPRTKGLQLPLSSDTLSGWGSQQASSHEANLLAATTYLCSTLVELVTRRVMEAMEAAADHLPSGEGVGYDENNPPAAFPDNVDIASILHQSGLPLRHLLLVLRNTDQAAATGYLTKCADRKSWIWPKGEGRGFVAVIATKDDEEKAIVSVAKSRIIGEMVARSIKHELRRLLRSSKNTRRQTTQEVIRFVRFLITPPQQTEEEGADLVYVCRLFDDDEIMMIMMTMMVSEWEKG
eukprot:jgi/Bigna1/127375/aug1.4_g2083